MNVASLRTQVALAAVPWLERVQAGQWSGLLHYHYEPESAGWTGRLQVAGAELDVPGMADVVRLTSARVQIDGSRVALDRMAGTAGKLSFTGEYTYEPDAARPHRLRLRAALVDAADLEGELAPTLRRAGLLARALGRVPAPDWLKERSAEGAIQIDDLAIAGSHWQNVRARLLWDVTRVEFDGLQAALDRASLAGKLSVSLRGARPSYNLTARLKGLSWQDGTVDAQGTVETSGTGLELLANLNSQGTFTGAGLDLGAGQPFHTVAGAYSLEWWQAAPRLRFTGLNLSTEDETYTGRGTTQDDGRLVILLSNGSREMRMSGTLAKLKVEEETAR
jgi:hypothetical protein